MKKISPLILIFLLGCSGTSSPPPTSDLYSAIPNTALIHIPPYKYIDESVVRKYTADSSLKDTIIILGDSLAYEFVSPGPECELCPEQAYRDSFSQHFEIDWTAFPYLDYVAVGIFEESGVNTASKPNRIEDSAKLVWTWNNGMPTGKEGHVEYNQGKSTENGHATNSLIPLKVNSDYSLIIWGWNEDATKITYSSNTIRLKIAWKDST